MKVRIYQPSRNVMQAGRAKTRFWVLECRSGQPRHIDPLMGWSGSSDTDGQIRIRFSSKESAVSYAEEQGMAYELIEKPMPDIRYRSYSSNFAVHRKQPWTH